MRWKKYDTRNVNVGYSFRLRSFDSSAFLLNSQTLFKICVKIYYCFLRNKVKFVGLGLG